MWYIHNTKDHTHILGGSEVSVEVGLEEGLTIVEGQTAGTATYMKPKNRLLHIQH